MYQKSKTLALSWYPLWNLLDDKQVVLSTWIICWKLQRNRLEIWKHPLNFSQNCRLKWEGNFLVPVNIPIHQRIGIKTSLGFFFPTGTFRMSYYDTLTFWGKYEGNFRMEISSVILWRKEGEISTWNFSFISLEFPQGNYEEISTGMIPWNSSMNPYGNLGDVDRLPAGSLRICSLPLVQSY